jgi:glycine cleavage system H protein
MNIPSTLLYSKDHEWIKVEGKQATLGVTDFAQSQLGDVVFVEVPALDTELAAGDGIGTIESVKAVSDVYCPVSGKVVAINDELENSPQLINEDPYGNGWICTVELANLDDLKDLLDAAAYTKLVNEEE